MALKARHQGAAWTQWELGARDRDPKAISKWRDQLAKQIDSQKLLQFVFFEQWRELREYARARGIRIMGDLPIYVAHDSADVWANRQYFRLDQQGNPIVVSGVPPDYFSKTGQLWGNPIYCWDVLAGDGYRWWLDRFRATFEMVDMIRLDHFRGFEAYWEIPASEPTAVHGRWVKGPGAELFHAAKAKLGELPLVAENLGVITPEVEAIRREFGFPGMAVLQFAFGTDPQAPTFRPHNYPREVVAYTGTHDNDTTVGWWKSQGSGDSTRSDEDIRRERDFAMRYPTPMAGDSVDFYSRVGGFGGRRRDRSSAGRAGIGNRGAHESAGDVGWKLAVAISSGCVAAGVRAANAGAGGIVRTDLAQ